MSDKIDIPSEDLPPWLRDFASSSVDSVLADVAVQAADEITALRARLAEVTHRNKEAVETLRVGFKSGDPTKTAAAIILAIAQLEGHGE